MVMRSSTALAVPPNAVASLPAPAVVCGVVRRVLFHEAGGPFTICLLDVDGAERPMSVVGRYPEVRAGEYLRCTGTWETHERYGRQLRATDVALVLPATITGIQRYLASPLVGGVGAVTARRLIEHFGADTLAALDAGAVALRGAPGIGAVRAERLSAAWREHQALREILLTLFDLGITYRRAEQLYQHYGAQISLLVRRDPYRLALDVRGIGFHTADRIARAAGVPAGAPLRLQAGLLHCLRTATSDGHTWLPEERLWEAAAALLQRAAEDVASPAPAVAPQDGEQSIGEEALKTALQHLVDADKVRVGAIGGEPAYALAAIDALERGLAGGLLRLATAPFDRMPHWAGLDDAAWDEQLGAQSLDGARLSDEQRAALRMALTARVAVLTGGPGTGKTTALRALVRLALAHGARIALAAPTGRAARRLAEATGLEARTVHRLLGRRRFMSGAAMDDATTDPLALDGLDEGAESPVPAPARPSAAALRADLVIVDEASMLDLPLARALVRAIPPGAHLLLVGDADQLPSVGPGQVLADIIASGRFPVSRLQRIYRHGEGSGIAANAQRINAGDMPLWEPGLGTNDFYLFNADDASTCRTLVLDLVTRRIPSRFGLSGSAIQVLAPMHRGPLGLSALNPDLQAVINPPDSHRPELTIGPRLLRVGDRVVQSRNNYDLGVFNGDLGTILALDNDTFSTRVLLDDGREVAYPSAALPELQLAYALSIHRAQGSEFPVVVLPVVTGQFILLSRRLLYTAVTRAQHLVVLVGHSRAISFAVRDAGSEARITALAERLREPPGPPEPALPQRRIRRRARPHQPTLL